MAVAVLFIILAILEIQANLVVIAAIGSSTFVVFVMPKARQARPRSLIGGHIVGLISGTICHLLFLWFSLPEGSMLRDFGFVFANSFAVGIAIFLMTITNTEHAPAAGTALAITIQGFTWTAVIFILVSTMCLSLARRMLRGWLRNLI